MNRYMNDKQLPPLVQLFVALVILLYPGALCIRLTAASAFGFEATFTQTELILAACALLGGIPNLVFGIRRLTKNGSE